MQSLKTDLHTILNKDKIVLDYFTTCRKDQLKTRLKSPNSWFELVHLCHIKLTNYKTEKLSYIEFCLHFWSICSNFFSIFLQQHCSRQLLTINPISTETVTSRLFLECKGADVMSILPNIMNPVKVLLNKSAGEWGTFHCHRVYSV